MVSDEQIDQYLDAVLRAAGSARRHYTLDGVVSEMRAAMRAVIEDGAAEVRAELDALEAWKEQVENQEPHSYIYRYMDPTNGDPVWLNRYGNWNGQIPGGCMPLYARPVLPAPSAPDEMMRDAERYRMLRRGQYWSVIDGIGNELRAEVLDAAADAVIAAAPKPEGAR